MTSPRIAVLGAGANGASIGADLTRAGLDVTLIEQWPAHVEAMRAYGLRVRMLHETQHTEVRAMHLCEVASLRVQFDVVLILMKAYDSRWAAHLIEPYLKDDGLLVGVQNGMTIDDITPVVGPHRTLGCVIEITSALDVPGTVERHSAHDRSWFAVGSMHPATEGREEEVAGLLRHSGAVDVVEDIRAAKWMKVVSNATTLVTSAVLGLPIAQACGTPAMRELMLRSGEEALTAASSLGHPPLPIFGLTPESLGSADGIVERLLDTLVHGFVLPQSTSTVLQDWAKGRRSEVDQINGLVVDVLASTGHHAPVNAAVVRLAHDIEHGRLTPGPHNIAALQALAECVTT